MRFHLLIPLTLLCVAAAPAPSTQPAMPAKCQSLLDTWKSRFDDEGFHTLIAPPFVIAGNGTAQQLEAYRDRTILAAAKALKATYFKADPTEPVLILLFE